jgi:hypothetical protein
LTNASKLAPEAKYVALTADQYKAELAKWEAFKATLK